MKKDEKEKNFAPGDRVVTKDYQTYTVGVVTHTHEGGYVFVQWYEGDVSLPTIYYRLKKV